MINQLGQLDKSIILLYLEEKSYEEIAEITGLTVTNVRYQVKPHQRQTKKMKKGRLKIYGTGRIEEILECTR